MPGVRDNAGKVDAMKCTNCLRSPCECETTAWAVFYKDPQTWFQNSFNSYEGHWSERYLYEDRSAATNCAIEYGGRIVRIRRKVKR